MKSKPDVRFVLEGAGTLEDLPLTDVAELLQKLAALVARGAAEEMSSPITGTGRWKGPVEYAAGLRLVGIRSGSVVAEFKTPPPVAPPGLMVVPELADRALDRMIDAASGNAGNHPTVAAAYADLLDRFSATPSARLVVVDLRSPGRRRRRASVSVSERGALRAASVRATLRDVKTTVTGRLFEADLEANTATVRTPAGDKVQVTFDAELAAEIRQRFGDRAQLRGELIFDPRTNQARSFRALEVLEGEQLAFGGVDFWDPSSLEELAAGQGTSTIDDPGVLALEGVAESEWGAFFEALGVG